MTQISQGSDTEKKTTNFILSYEAFPNNRDPEQLKFRTEYSLSE